MHTWPMDAPCGFDQRLVVENKERIRKFTGSEFIDEWDKALASHRLKRPLRMDYRELPDYRERLGAFEWALPDDLHSDVFTGDLAAWWIPALCAHRRAALPADRIPGSASSLRSGALRDRPLRGSRHSRARGEAGRPRQPADRLREDAAPSRRAGRPTPSRIRSIQQWRRERASAPTTSPTSR